MQDNYPQEFDEQFIDEAWLKMHQLLDKEMPVQPKRRVAGWLWLVAGLCLFVMLGGAGYYLYHSGKTPDPSPAAAPPTARLEEYDTDESQDKLQPEKPGALAEPKGNGHGLQDAGNRPEPAGGPQQTIAEIEGTKVTSGTEAQAVKPVFLMDTRPEEKIKGGKNLTSKEYSEGVQRQVAPPEELAGPKAAYKIGITPLALLSGQAIQVRPHTKEEQTGELPHPTYRKPNALRLAVEGGAYFLGYSAPDGLSAGLALEARPGHHPLYLRAGAFFRSYRQELKTDENILHLENTFSKVPQPDGNIVNSTSKLAASSTITAARYIQFPLSAGFQWSPRLSFEAGLQAGLLLSSEATSSWRLIDQSNSSGTPRQEENTIFEFENEAGKDKLNRTSLDFIAGIAYRPGLRASLRLSYQYGLSDMLTSPGEKASIQAMQLSLAYYIIQ
ncbi:MAG: outer membrane beta-barrel protein [Phaeodactylibacter sp.]|nr:outer membrane beta-barrel protein [Phaeodactylibacter sp.]